VVWSNIYGRDDEITPRGMGVRFLKIYEEDQKYISDLIEEHKEPDVEESASEYLATKFITKGGDKGQFIAAW
jgi:hypothetical protein